MVKYGDILIIEDGLVTRVELNFDGERTFLNESSETCLVDNYTDDLSSGIDDGDPVISKIIRPVNINLIRASLPCLREVLLEVLEVDNEESESEIDWEDHNNEDFILMWERPKEKKFNVTLDGEDFKVNQFTLDEMRSLIE